ncbi:MAG: hypothetical protein HOV83_01670, partial [Catenulispora sp.]|nr:hypothetical protein [Catenulispora sp.]
MSAVDAAGENAMRGLIGTAFTAGEPALPAVDEVMATVEALGEGIRHRQRVRTGIAAGALCVAAFGMVAGIAAVAHSTHGGGGTVLVPAGGAPVVTGSAPGAGLGPGADGAGGG